MLPVDNTRITTVDVRETSDVPTKHTIDFVLRTHAYPKLEFCGHDPRGDRCFHIGDHV